MHFAPLVADIHEAANAVCLSREAQVPEWKGFAVQCEACQDNRWQITPKGAIPCPACSKPKPKVHPMPKKTGGAEA